MISSLWKFLIFVVLSAALGSICAFANGNSQGKGKGKGHGEQGESVNVRYGFGPHEREIITHYYAGHDSNLPPGLAKRHGNLPPGLEKQLVRNGTLPPGLQKKIEPCPIALERQLPRLPDVYRRGVIGGHIVVFNRNTKVIVDIFSDLRR